MAQPGFHINPHVETDPALLGWFDGLPAAVISDDMGRLTGAWGPQSFPRPG